jgi:hypothetical protein
LWDRIQLITFITPLWLLQLQSIYVFLEWFHLKLIDVWEVKKPSDDLMAMLTSQQVTLMAHVDWTFCFFLAINICIWTTSVPSLLLQQKVLLYVKWFRWILSEFAGPSKQELVRIHWSNEQGQLKCTHILYIYCVSLPNHAHSILYYNFSLKSISPSKYYCSTLITLTHACQIILRIPIQKITYIPNYSIGFFIFLQEKNISDFSCFLLLKLNISESTMILVELTQVLLGNSIQIGHDPICCEVCCFPLSRQMFNMRST